MKINFNSYNEYDIPVMTLANPNRSEIGQLGLEFNRVFELNFNALSQVTFDSPSKIIERGKEIINPYYDLLTVKRLVKIEDFGWFEITGVEKTYDGIRDVKAVTLTSYECVLNRKKINLFDGTYKFWDITSPKDTLLGKIIEGIPDWSIDYVSADLWNKYRTFEISDNTVYNFLMTDAEQSYECIFVFDTDKKTISAYDTKDIVESTSVILGYNNCIQNLNMTEVPDEITTALAVYGSDVFINGVNPLGGSIIYNFDYFKTPEWMSQSLINALNAWEAKIEQYQPIYSKALTNKIELNNNLISQTTKLTDLNSQLASAQEVQSVQIAQGIDKSDPSAYNDTLKTISALETQIKELQVVIDGINTQIKTQDEEISSINKELQFENNFTEEQYKELSSYIYESTYQDDTFVTTSSMNTVEKMQVAQELYDQGMTLAKKIAQPRYTMTIDGINYMFLPDFSEFTKQTKLGCTMAVELRDDYYVDIVLLSVHFSFDDPTDFSFTFGNRYRLDNAEWQFSDLYEQSAKSSSTVNFNYSGWKDWQSYQGEVTSFINDNLDAARNNVVSSKDQNTVINGSGIRQRMSTGNDSFSPEQIWITNNVIAISKDNFNTVSTAIGKVGNTGAYGVNAELLAGKMLIGNQLVINNEKNTFIVDAGGAKLIDASFTLTTKDKQGKIVLDPSEGIYIAGGNQMDKRMWLDSAGNLNLVGKLTVGSSIADASITNSTIGTSIMGSGSVGGFTIDSDRIYSNNGNIILYSNGNAHIGALDITGSTATFNGNFYAHNILGSFDFGQSNTLFLDGSLGQTKIANLTADLANIRTLIADKASISQLNATNAQINSLWVDKASVGDLNAANAQINSLWGDKASYNYVNTMEINAERIYGHLSKITNLNCDNCFAGYVGANDTFINTVRCSSLRVGNYNAVWRYSATIGAYYLGHA